MDYFIDPTLRKQYAEVLDFGISVASCFGDNLKIVCLDFSSLKRQILDRDIDFPEFMDSVKFPAAVLVANISGLMRDAYLVGDKDWKLYAKQVKRLSVLL